MTNDRGLWEHARFTTPRTEHGYCTDDNARALIVVSRMPGPSPTALKLAPIYLGFLRDAQVPSGGFHNRLMNDGSWADQIGSDDSQGRAIWALGSIARLSSWQWMRDIGIEIFNKQQRFQSPSPRASAFAVLGAAEVLAAAPDHRVARTLLERCIDHIPFQDDTLWPWPEKRLAYDNARLPEALLAGGAHLPDDRLVNAGLRLLAWLVEVETNDDHFSFTPVKGWEPGEPRPGFDQQPIEAAAMADACYRAWTITRDNRWSDLVEQAARWFAGANDAGLALYDAQTGGCGDGLGADYINLNQGAESTLAALATLNRAHEIPRSNTHPSTRSRPKDLSRLGFSFAF